MALPGFKTTTTTRSVILEAAVQLVFLRLETIYPLKRLDKLADISSGGTPSRSESAFYGGEIPWAKISDVTAAGKWISETEEGITQTAIEQSSAKLFPIGTVLFSMYGSIGKTSVAACPITTNQAILGLIPYDGIESEYLYYALINARTRLFGQSKGTSQKNINGGMVKNFEIPLPPKDEIEKIIEYLSLVEEGQPTNNLSELPAYLQETHRIVARIEALAGRIAEAQSLRQSAAAQTEALLKSARNSVFGEDPEKDWVHLQTFVKGIVNGRSPQCEKRPAKLDEWGVLKVGAASFGWFNENENKALPPTLQPNPDYEVKPGDFLMIRANTRELVGACAIVGKTRSKLLLSDKTFRFVFRQDKEIEPVFLDHVLKSPALRTQIEQQASGTSPTMKNISKAKVLDLLVPDYPLDEQRRIVAYLDGLSERVNALRRLQEESQEELDALLPSVLDRAFKGEL